jgi:hypothetical protein
MFSAIRIWREGWTGTEVVDPHSILPTTNVFGLYWKPSTPSTRNLRNCLR